MKEEYLSEESDGDCCSRNGLSICLTVFLIISLTGFGTVSYYFIKYHLDSASEEVCTEIQCVKSSTEIDEYVDEEVDPCVNFHSFVCGKFMKTAYEKQQKHPLQFEYDRLENKINSFIVEPATNEDVKPVAMQKRYFRSCLNEDKIDENNNALFFRLFHEIGGWPILNDEQWSPAKEISFDWIEAMRKALHSGLPFDWFLDIDIHDNGHYLLKISKPKSCSNVNSNPPREQRIFLMANITASFKNYNINHMPHVYQIINFEEKLEQICRKVSDESISVGTLRDLDTIWFAPENKSLDFIKQMTGYHKKWHKYSEVAYHENYILRLRDLLTNTSKETLANFIGWKIIEAYAPYMSKPIRDKYMDYLNKISEKEVNRFQFCLQDTKSKFNLVSETMYIREYTTEAIQEAGEEMVNTLKEEMKSYINNLDSINNDTKNSYSQYYADLEVIIGAPKDVFDDTIFDRALFVGQINFRSFNIIHMNTHWSQALFFSKMRMIDQRSPSSFLKFAYLANRGIAVMMDPSKKALFLPATLFHGVIFHVDRPKYLNYASLGSLISKKLVEVFQVVDNYTNNMSEEQVDCMIKSINTVNSYLDSSLLVQSNYPDLLGRHIAYKAYQKLVEENGEELSLVGLSYTPNKLFWIKSSINWCYQDLPNEDSNPVVREMLRYRIVETVKHSPNFGEDFECEENAKMNPTKKCPFD